MTSFDARLDALEARLRESEDRLAIYQLIATYGPSVDTVTPESLGEMWVEDGVYDAGGFAPMVGRGEIRDMLQGDAHQGYIARGCSHIMSMPHLRIDGDIAVATGYSTVFAGDGDHWTLVRLSANRWELVRTPRGWRVRNRTNRLLEGNDESRALLVGGTEI